MNLKQANLKVNQLLWQIDRCGDQDECSMKHVGHGTSMLIAGLDPSIQEDYIDYTYGGTSHDLSDYDNEIYIASEFQEDKWKEVKTLFDKFGEEVLDGIPNFYIGNYVEWYVDKVEVAIG